MNLLSIEVINQAIPDAIISKVRFFHPALRCIGLL